MKSYFAKKRVLVTGACGTIGKELVRQLIEDYRVKEIIGLDNNESELFFLEQNFSDYKNASFFLADVRDKEKLYRKMDAIDIVFHTAAFKHVILCERSPFEAVQTNILGVQNIIEAANEKRVKKVIFTSSDKAVNPTNVMGTSKLMGERIMTAANNYSRDDETIFASVRFGNILGSRGSVVPIFRQQIKQSGPLTLTDDAMTRFIMSIKEAVQMIIDSALLACGGEVFVTKMNAIKIRDIAEVLIDELSPIFGISPEKIKIKKIGTKPGEKLYEELMNIEETRRAIELERYFVILPAFTCAYRQINYIYEEIISNSVSTPYHSGNVALLSKKELIKILRENNLLIEKSEHAKHPAERYWPDGNRIINQKAV
jgi:FlaA1/EpsC-like NDP-sugar epimerase